MMTTTASTISTPPISRVSTRDRALGVSGIAFAALLLPVVLIPHASLDYEPTKPPKDPGVITDFFQAHHALEQYQAIMHSFAGVALLVFVAALASRVRAVEGSDRIASRLMLGAGASASAVMIVTMTLVSGSITMTGAIDGHTQGWLYGIGWYEHFKMLYLVPLVLVPACRVLGQAGALPRALSWSGHLVAVLCVVAMVGGLSAGTEFLMFPVFMMLIVWVLATGIISVTRGWVES